MEDMLTVFAGVVGVLAGVAGTLKVVSKKTKTKVDDKVAKKLDEAVNLAKKVPLADIVALVKKLK